MKDNQIKIERCIQDVLGLEANFALNEKTRLREELGIDSITIIRLLNLLEKVLPDFEITIEDLTEDVFETVASLTSYVETTIRKAKTAP